MIIFLLFFPFLQKPIQAVDCSYARYLDDDWGLNWFEITNAESGCRFTGINGLTPIDLGTNASNSAILKVPPGKTLTVGAGDTLVVGQLKVDGTLQINNGAQIAIGAVTVASDVDGDTQGNGTFSVARSIGIGQARPDFANGFITDCDDNFKDTDNVCVAKSDAASGGYQGRSLDSLLRGLVGKWTLNESSGALVDTSSYGNNGTATGTISVQGKVGKARIFGTSSDFIAVSDNTALDLPGAYSFSAWVNPTSVTSCDTSSSPKCIIFNKEQSYQWALDNTGTVFWALTPSWAWTTTGITVSTNTWTHLALTYDGAYVRLYKNGILSYTGAKTGIPDNTSQSFRIGGREDNSSSYFFPGKIDEVQLWNRALTNVEVISLAKTSPNIQNYYQPINDKTPGLVALWHLDETGSNVFQDSSGNLQHAAPFSCGGTGGTLTTTDADCIHTFTSNGTFTPPENISFVQTLLVGGGGGGGGGNIGVTGGGGGGGVVYNANLAIGQGNYSVVVGEGGAGGTTQKGTNGGNSTFNGLIAYGGGGGGACIISSSTYGPGANGGTGGGGGCIVSSGEQAVSSGGTGTSGQGYSGGYGLHVSGSYQLSGGGGGAGAVGGNAVATTTVGNGGAGATYSISGSSVTYGGGGGGGRVSPQTGGAGGSGGGGAGAFGSTAPVAGTNGLGGGGGGSYPTSGNLGANGGSGVVIIRYPKSNGTTVASGISNTNARTFNGTTDVISIPNSTAFDFKANDFTLSWWEYRTDSGNTRSAIQRDNSTNPPWVAGYANNSNLYFFATSCGASCGWDIADSKSMGSITLNQWVHLAITRNGNVFTTYKNGVPQTTWTSTKAILDGSYAIQIGRYLTGGSYSFKGMMDDVAIFNRGLSEFEIKQIAQLRTDGQALTDVIDMGTPLATKRIQWTPSGTRIGDGETPINSTGLVAQWNFNETSGTTALSGGSCSTACNGTLTNMTTSGQDAAVMTGWTAVNKRWGAGAVMFDGSNDYINVPDNNALSFTNRTFSIEAWVNPGKYINTNWSLIVAKGAANNWEYGLYLEQNTNKPALYIWPLDGASSDSVTAKNPIYPGQWNHIVGTADNATMKIYVNGNLEGTVPLTKTMSNGTSALNIGRRNDNQFYFRGIIDSVRIYSRTLSPDEIVSNYNAGTAELQYRECTGATIDTCIGQAWQPTTSEAAIDGLDSSSATWKWDIDKDGNDGSIAANMPKTKTDDTAIKVEGSGSLKITTGIIQSDANTRAIWHFDETDSASNSIKDSVNTNHGTPTGSTVVDGIAGKARSFNGSSDYINIPNNATLNITGALTIDAWVYPTVTAQNFVVGKWDSGQTSYYLGQSSTGQIMFGVSGGTAIELTGATALSLYTWHHIAGVYVPSTSLSIYLDGVLNATCTTNCTNGATPASITAGTSTINIGRRTTNDGLFTGKIDEVRISAVARTSAEIHEAYIAGAGHRISKTISATDLTTKTKIPFWVAADRPGYIGDLTIGESAFANGEPDANTVGLYHFEENSAFVKLASLVNGGAISYNTLGGSYPFTLFRGECSDGTSGINATFATSQLANATTGVLANNAKKVMLGYAGGYGIYNTTQNVCSWSSAYQMIGAGYNGSTCGTYPSNMPVGTAFVNSDANLDAGCNVNLYMKDGAAKTKDSSINANHGIMNSFSTAQGYIGLGHYFDGQGTSIELGSPAYLDFGNNGAFTFSGWVKPETLYNYSGFVSKNSTKDTPYSYMTVFQADGRLGAYNGSSWIDICPAGSIVTGQWQHVAFVYNGTTLTGYVNGQRCGAASFTYTDDPNDVVYIGSWYKLTFENDYDFKGSMDEIRIDNIARSAADIRVAYEIGKRTHPIIIEFAASPSNAYTAGNGTISLTSTTNLAPGDTIIIKETTSAGTTIEQRVVNSISGTTVTLASGFSNNYSTNAYVTKWQKEWFDIADVITGTGAADANNQKNAITRLTLRLTENTKGATIWLDDIKSGGPYMTGNTDTTITFSQARRYFQLQQILSSSDMNVSPAIQAIKPYADNSMAISPMPTAIIRRSTCQSDGTVCTENSNCCSAVCTQFYLDNDGDTYGNPNNTTKRCGTTYSGYASNNTDCYDSNANAHPGSTYCSATNRGDGSYDYDCSGTATACMTCAADGDRGLNWCELGGPDCEQQWAYNPNNVACGVQCRQLVQGLYKCSTSESTCNSGGGVWTKWFGIGSLTNMTCK